MATITCPKCGQADEVEAPTDSCLFFHECSGCQDLLKPLAGDCCVICSFGDEICPPKLDEDSRCD